MSEPTRISWACFVDENGGRDFHVLPCLGEFVCEPHRATPSCPCNPRQQDNDKHQNKIWVHEPIQ